MSSRSRMKVAAVAAILVAAAACTDLNVTNPNEPDRSRALREGQDVEALIAGTFRTWWGLQQGNEEGGSLTNLANALSAAADETANSGLAGVGEVTDEPRIAVINVDNYRWGAYHRDSWFRLSRALAAIRDGVQAVEGGVKVGANGADNPRLLAFAKLMQGLALGHIAVIYDRGFVLDETIKDLETVKLVPYGEVMSAARAYLAKARELSSKSSFTIPSGWMGTKPYANQELVRIANSYEARFMAQVARTPEERAKVDWAGVLSRVQQGVTQDFGVQLDGPGGKWRSSMKGKPRVRLPHLGPADQSGGWQKWEQSDPTKKFPFLVDTDDRRITGGSPTRSGKLIEYWPDITANPARGLWFFSNYEFLHWLTIFGGNLGFAPDLTVQEMQFLAAEAYIRLGQPERALPIINKTRVEIGELPPATVAGVSGSRCVPRTVTGACGNLLQTLTWEKQIHLSLLSQGSIYYDKRGFGTLRKGTWLHLPVPAKELLTLKEAVYTFGGVSGRDAAPGT